MFLSVGDDYSVPAATSQHVETGEVRVRGVPGSRSPPASHRQVQAEPGRAGARGDDTQLQ